MASSAASSVLAACCGALADTPWRLARPRRADQRFLSALAEGRAEPPKARCTVRLTALPQGGQWAPTAVVAEGVWSPLRTRMSMGGFLVEHPEARFVVDPGVCSDVHSRVLPELPSPFRALVAPERPVTGLPEALERVGKTPEDIDFALPTHLHWDHVSGLLELPGRLPVRSLPVERAHALDGPTAPLGFARLPLQDRQFEPYELDGPPVLTFARSHDLFGDGSVVLVDLAGHTPGSVGVLLALSEGRRVLLAGDAVWHSTQITHLREKAPMPGRLVDHDRTAAFAVIHRLHALPPEVDVVASHDHTAMLRHAV